MISVVPDFDPVPGVILTYESSAPVYVDAEPVIFQQLGGFQDGNSVLSMQHVVPIQRSLDQVIVINRFTGSTGTPASSSARYPGR